MIRNYKLILPLFMLLIILTACGDKYEGDFSYQVEDFTYVDQNGDTVSKKDLDGTFWIADFIFTNCETVCPPMTANKAKLQQKLNDAGLEDVQLISFSVDPERDTPGALKKYGLERGISFDNAHFLTGYEFDEIKAFSVSSFKSALEEIPDSDQIMHVTSFFIVSPKGDAIKRYNGTQVEEMDQIVQDLKAMK